MKRTEKYLLNCVNLFLSQCVENNTVIKTKDIITMFSQIFNNDLSYMKLCPDGLENELQELVENIYKYQTDNFRNSSLKVLLKCFYDDLRYQISTNMQISDKDKDILWFKALIANQISYNMLSEFNTNVDLGSFNAEHNEIGSLLNNYYSEKDQNKAKIIKDIINSKVRNFFSRYNICFDLPRCAS